MLAPISSTNTKRSASTLPEKSSRQADLKNSSRSPAASDLFSAPSHGPEHPGNGGLAHRDTGYPPEVLATLGGGGRGAFFKICFQEPPGTLVHLWLGAGPLLRGEGASLLGQLGVALDRGAAHPEGASGLALGRAPPEGLDDLLAQVFGVGVHAYTVPYGPSTLQTALSALLLIHEGQSA